MKNGRVISLHQFCIMSVLFILPCVVGCQSKAETVVDLRRERTELLRQHRETFDSSALRRDIDQKIDELQKSASESDKKLVGLATNFMKDLTQATEGEIFIENCSRVGRGEAVDFFDERSREFFTDPKNIKVCEDIYLKGVKIECLESDDSAWAWFKC